MRFSFRASCFSRMMFFSALQKPLFFHRPAEMILVPQDVSRHHLNVRQHHLCQYGLPDVVGRAFRAVRLMRLTFKPFLVGALYDPAGVVHLRFAVGAEHQSGKVAAFAPLPFSPGAKR